MSGLLTLLTRTLLIPVILTLAAYLMLPYLRATPQAWQPLLQAIPYSACLLALCIALLFNQGRVFFLALLLGLGYWALNSVATTAAIDAFHAAVIFTACSILLPLNFAIFTFLKEKGLLNLSGILRSGFLLAQVIFVGWVIRGEKTELLLSAAGNYLPFGIEAIRLPDLGVITLLLVAGLLSWRLWREQSVLDGSILALLLPFAIAANWAGTIMVPEAFMTAAGLTLALGLILHTHRIAYRDELTGLPGRRALNERLAALGRRYTIAMLDVDHFKKFNDTYGHDVGDQVLRMVASRIRGVGGGGKAYRYGGEEFTIVFPGKSIEHSLEYLENVREEIANYALVLRSNDRPADRKRGRERRGSGKSAKPKTTHVTISIGVAARNDELRQPDMVVKAADEALYRAKKGGRNRVSK
ncbi:diguanylate cyclase [Alkalilimnicola ehrlichii]|uniref:GGDEF domain-containing protein n=1 Tax=Alkalilimnicola ehrlichii TaxID=351052 RepID=UPI0015F263C9|nr:GGDEF domain-containing protein [Alkalilimnicola ehrlichii]